MRKSPALTSLDFIICVLAISLLAGCQDDPAGTGGSDPCDGWGDSCCDVLMIGNSLTAYNDTPGILQELADSSGVDMNVQIALYLGHSLQMIVEETNVFEKIRREPWDYVVIQGSSYYIAFPDYHDLILPPVQVLADSIYDNEPCTKIVFFMDWCMKDGVELTTGEHLTFHEFQVMIRRGTLIFADEHDFMVAPCGVAWDVVLAADPDIVLHDADGGHPGPKGSYLNACVYYSTLMKLSSRGIGVFRDIPADEALFFQDAASSIVLDSLAIWNIE